MLTHLSTSLFWLCCLAIPIFAQDANGPPAGAPAPPWHHHHGDPQEKIKTAHAVLSCVAWVFFFPMGSIIIRVLKTSNAIWIHVAAQAFGLVLYTIGTALGIQTALDKDELNLMHPIIGLVVFAVMFFQSASGIVHHLLFRKRGRRTAPSYIHIWIGRALITLGMINGGLGLLLSSDALRSEYIAYGVVAGIIWVTWMSVDVWASLTKTTPSRKGSTSSSSSEEKPRDPIARQ